MSNNQPPFSENRYRPSSPPFKRARITNQLFPPHLNLAANVDQPTLANTAAQQELPQPGSNEEMAANTTILKPGNPQGNFFGSSNPVKPNNNAPEITQSFAPNNYFQSINYQDNSSTQGTENLSDRQSDTIRGIITGQLSSTPTGTLMQPMGEYSGNTGMLKLNQAVKVVRMPIAGRPGEFKTGILPVIPQSQTGALPPPSNPDSLLAKKTKLTNKMILLIALVFLILLGSSSYYLLHTATSTPQKATNPTNSVNKGQTHNSAATADVNATATAIINASLVSESLSYADRDRAQGEQNAIDFAFENGAYHIRQDGKYFGYALIPGFEAPKSYTYNLTMQNIHYDQANTSNLSFYGMVFNYQSYNNNKNSTFYVFRVNNGNDVTYEFDKYDDRHLADNESPWKQLFPSKDNDAGINGKGTSHEFKGRSQKNVYSISDQNGIFTFSVNGTKIGTVKDTSFSGGGLGMGVSQTKSEAAFSNLSVLSN